MGRQETPPAQRFSRAIAAELRAIMARKTPRVTGVELGNAPGVGRSQNYIAKRLRGDLPFNLDDLDRICAFLGVDSAALIRRVNERLSDPQQEGEEDDR